MFITSKNKYLSNDKKIFGTCSISLISDLKARKNAKITKKKSSITNSPIIAHKDNKLQIANRR